MHRFIDEQLKRWKEGTRRKPLILRGARQVGKTWSLKELGKNCFESLALVDLERNLQLRGLFDGDLGAARICSDLEVLLRQKITPGKTLLFFDEIQIVKGWETYINQLLREGYKVFITGSNASMLSRELGTHLTGRHLPMELFPFSYPEFIRFKALNNGENAVLNYLKEGGMPEYVKTGASVVLNTLVDDILMRDIAIRHNIRDVNSLRQLTAYLITNIGNLVSASKLVGMFSIKSPATFLEYFSFLKDAYLLEFVPIFSHSLKVQARNPKKYI